MKRTLSIVLMGSGIPDSSGVIRYTVKSTTRPKVVHAIRVWPGTGRVACSCEAGQHFACNPAHLHRAGDRHCKHVREFLRTLLRDCLAARGEEVAA